MEGEMPVEAPGQPSPLSPDLGDWRLMKTGWVSAIDGKPVDKPLSFSLVTHREVNGVGFSFPTPSATALHLNAAWREAAEAARLQSELRWKQSFIPGHTGQTIDPEHVGALFDFFEHLIGTAIFSFAGVEAFCNAVIVENANSPIHVKRKRGVEQLSPDDAERSLSTDEKLRRVLPSLLGTASPAGKEIWQRYIRLRELRDAVTHFKRKDQSRRAPAQHEPTALLAAYQTDPYTLPEAAVAMIKYFHKPQPVPRWLMNPEWVRGRSGLR